MGGNKLKKKCIIYDFGSNKAEMLYQEIDGKIK